jgi:rare lipoprotein A
MTAAHKSLPFGTRVRVTHLGNGRSVTVTINDRGPYIAGRIIDLSRAAASAISMTGQGVARIRMTVLGR